MAKAKEHNMVVVINLFELEDGKTYDSSPVIDADGTLLGTTQMVHVADYECFYEKSYYAEGNHGAPVYDTAVGKIGVAICYDRHYPEFMRALGVNGAEVVVIPQAGTVGEWPDGLYEAELQVASFHNGYFCALANRVGKEDQMEFAGESVITNPEGRVIAQSPGGVDDILIHDETDLDLAHIIANWTSHPTLPEPIGVIYCIDKPTYNQEMINQIEAAKKAKGSGNVQGLLNAGDTWIVD